MNVKVVALLAALAAGPAFGDDEAITADPVHAPAMLRDDVPGGKYRNWRGDLSCGTNAVRAVFHIAKLYTDPRWAPVMKIGLGEEPAKLPKNLDPDLRRISLEFVRFNPDQTLEIAVSLADGRREIQRSDYKVEGALGQSIPIEIRWDENGGMTMKVGGQTLRGVHLSRAPTSVDFDMSGVQGQIGGIEVGRLGPPAACAAPAAPGQPSP